MTSQPLSSSCHRFTDSSCCKTL